jgi:3-hydroxyisobutyrate dehydrogenase
VIAWDRNPDHSRPLAERGAEMASTAGEVVSGADATSPCCRPLTSSSRSSRPLLDAWPQETVWLQMSSVGAAEADRLLEVATAHGLTMFDAPVSGSTHPAEEGRLTILASGPGAARGDVEPVFAEKAFRAVVAEPAERRASQAESSQAVARA